MLNNRQKSFTSRCARTHNSCTYIHIAKCVRILSRISAKNTCRDIKASALKLIYFPQHNTANQFPRSPPRDLFFVHSLGRSFLWLVEIVRAGSCHSLRFDEFTDSRGVPLARSPHLCRTLTWTSSSSRSFPSSIGL